MGVPAAFTLQLPDVFPEPVVGVDAGGQIVYLNEAGERWFGNIRFQAARDMLPVAGLDALKGLLPEPEACRLVSGERRVARWMDVTPPSSAVRILLARDVTEQFQTAQTLSNRMRRLEVVHSITLAIARGQPVGTIGRMALDNLQSLLGLKQATLASFDGRRLQVQYSLIEGVWSEGGKVYTLDATPAASAVYRHTAVQMRTTGVDALQWKQFRTLDRQGVRAVLYVPLIANAEVMGLLTLGTGDIAGFTPDDVQAATEVAAQLSTALVRQRLDEAEEQVRVLGAEALDALANHKRKLEAAVAERTRELQTAQQALIQATKLSTLGELAAGLAHELSQPISVISGHAELLHHTGPDASRLEHSLVIITAAAQRMARLVEDIRNFAGVGDKVLEPFDLREAVEMALELSCRVHPDVLVRWDPPPDPVMTVGDKHRIEQVLINLLTNARFATSEAEGRSVAITLAERDNEVLIEVTDEGGGVPEEIQEKLFDPFFTTKGSDGTGLGLSISARIAQEHGGRLESENLERGARFRLVLRPA